MIIWDVDISPKLIFIAVNIEIIGTSNLMYLFNNENHESYLRVKVTNNSR